MPDDEQCHTDTDTRDADGEPDAEEAPGVEGESDADEDSSLLETVPLPWLLAAITEAVRPFSPRQHLPDRSGGVTDGAT